MFESLLIANRGEIACRVIRTARTLGIRTVAVYSEVDAGALHVEMADEAYPIGPAPAADSYLRGDRIVETARRSGAQTIHPGYGFLAENADFAQACADAGIAFIGPPVAAIRAMGSKSGAKTLMEKAGVAVVPGYHGNKQDAKTLRNAADKIGYPVLIKAVSGGGGKGMRRVADGADFAAALESARREAKSAFGDDRMLIEKYLETPRHIEFQIFADNEGNIVHLFERDCSIQRRHQKIIEESPAPGMTPALREAMGEAAVEAARAVGYRGAGTVEFIIDVSNGLDKAPFYFMEMNTRLQVEHPVTEMITGHDLVAWQLRVAAGEPLPCRPDELSIRGHAIEARIYAEDPARDFLPQTGCLARLRTPAEGKHVRIDSGVREGDAVSIHYDPMIAKLIVWDEDRAAAVERLCTALFDFRVVGPTTNIPFLGRVAGHPAFAGGRIDTGFIKAFETDLLPKPEPVPDPILALACLDILLARSRRAGSAPSGDPFSPWNSVAGWRLNDRGFDILRFLDGEREIAVTVHFTDGAFDLELPGGRFPALAEIDPAGDLVADLEGERLEATVVRDGTRIQIVSGGASHELLRHDPRLEMHDEDEASDIVIAPMPGKVIKVFVTPGMEVAKGDALVILEAMKMEHTIAAAAAAVIGDVPVKPGQQVEEGDIMVTFSSHAEAGQ